MSAPFRHEKTQTWSALDVLLGWNIGREAYPRVVDWNGSVLNWISSCSVLLRSIAHSTNALAVHNACRCDKSAHGGCSRGTESISWDIAQPPRPCPARESIRPCEDVDREPSSSISVCYPATFLRWYR